MPSKPLPDNMGGSKDAQGTKVASPKAPSRVAPGLGNKLPDKM